MKVLRLLRRLLRSDVIEALSDYCLVEAEGGGGSP